jgi:hypothetical protein
MPGSSWLEDVPTDLGNARTGHLDHHLSTTFEQFTCFPFEMHLEKSQRTLQTDSYQAFPS